MHHCIQRPVFYKVTSQLGTLFVNEEETQSWPAFLIDLDLALNKRQVQSSGARSKTGTTAFMVISLLSGEKHSFTWLGVFFWILFWICIHYRGNEGSRVVSEFDKWNYATVDDLANLKKGTIDDESDLVKNVYENMGESTAQSCVSKWQKMEKGGSRFVCPDERRASGSKERSQGYGRMTLFGLLLTGNISEQSENWPGPATDRRNCTVNLSKMATLHVKLISQPL